jgi:hypothetical protein
MADIDNATIQFTEHVRQAKCPKCGEAVGVLQTRDGKEGMVDIEPRMVWAPWAGKEIVLAVRGKYPIRIMLPVDGAPVCEARIPHRLTCASLSEN